MQIGRWEEVVRVNLEHLLRYKPSQDLKHELEDLKALTDLSKDLLKLHGNFYAGIYTLIDRKAELLSGTRYGLRMQSAFADAGSSNKTLDAWTRNGRTDVDSFYRISD